MNTWIGYPSGSYLQAITELATIWAGIGWTTQADTPRINAARTARAEGASSTEIRRGLAS